MDYFNAGGGAAGNGAGDPYAVIPQQFGNGGQQPQQTVYPEYQQEGGVVDYETYQQQQQYRGAQQSQPSPSLYYQAQMNQASYFPIHSASEHDFLGPQQPATGTSTTSAQNATPYQGRSGANKEFMLQHQQRRGNQSGAQQSQNAQQSGQPGQQNQSGRQQNQQQMQQQQSQQSQQNQQQSHFMHHQMQAAQQQQAQQIHRLHGAPINTQQFMVPPPTMLQAQQQQVHQMHQMQHMNPQQQHPQLIQQQQNQQAYHSVQTNQQQTGGHHQHHQNPNQHHNQNHPGPHHIPQNQVMQPPPPRVMLRDWPIRCVVEAKYQPLIIGENGSTIREIAQSCHCRVEFVNLSKKERIALGNPNDRILTVHGHAEQASKAVARILDVIQTEAAVKEDSMVGAEVLLRLRAHNQLCGRLIGKNGNSIKDIMQKTGTTITVTKYIDVPINIGEQLRTGEMLGIQERTILIKGPSIEAVVQAESLISAKLKKCYESDSQLRAQTVQMAPVMMPPLPPPVTPMIPGAQLIPTPVGMMQIQHFARSQHHQLTQNNAFLAPGALQIAPGVSNLRHVRVWVPDNMIGALIGAKGKNIKMIIRDTGAIVKIEAPEEKAQREAEEAEKKQKKNEETENGEHDGAASGDHPQEFLEDNGTVTSSDAIEEKPKPVSERMVTITGDDLQLLKAQSFVFTKIADTTSPQPVNGMELPILTLKLRTEICVPTKIIGRIIGKGGQNVRELQRITGACVKIPEDERNGGSTFTHDDGLVEEMTLIRMTGHMYSTHNVQFRLAHLVGEYYRGGEHLPKSAGRGGRPQSAPGKDGSGLDKMDQLGQVPPLANNATSPKTQPTPKSKSP